ncbi:MAG TPA: LysM peptidoglycan-binding domain-containing protein [Candidatus Limnocylindria bacterium]
MDRICPYLAIATDRRSVVDGFDPDHRCQAASPPEALSRTEQATLCLTESHVDCVRFLAAREAWASSLPIAPRPAPDAFVPRTRLVLQPSGGRRLVGPSAPFAHARRRWAIGGAVTLLAFAAAASAASGQLDGVLGVPRDSGSPAAVPTEAASEPPSATASPTVLATVQPSVTPLPSPLPTPSSVASSEPTPRTYTVVSGDTLSAIAARFGTTVAAIQSANGLSGETINIGQVLVIP